MGLLSKTVSIEKKEKQTKKSGGLLARALSKSGAQAESHDSDMDEISSERERMEDSEAEIRAGGGLLQRAHMMAEKPHAEGGLLGRASSLIQEQGEKQEERFEEEAPSEKEERFEEEAPSEKEEPLQEEAPSMGEIHPLVRPSSEEEITAAKAQAEEEGLETAEPAEETAAVEHERLEEAETPASSVMAAEREQEKPVSKGEKRTFAVLCEKALAEADSTRIIELFEDTIGSEGYTSFFSEVLGVFKTLARGDSAILYIRSDAKYKAEYFDPESTEVKKCAKKTFRMQSKLINMLKEKTQGIRSLSLKDDAVLKEVSSFGQLEPWMLIPLGFGEKLHGFVVIGNQPKRPKIDTDGLIMLAHLTAQIVVRYSEEMNHAKELGRLEKESSAQENLLRLSALLDTVRGGIKEAFRVLCESIGVEAAVFLKGWSEKGRMYVEESLGIPERVLRRYTLSKSDREIKRIVENGEPALLKDAEKRCAKLSKQKEEQLKTFIVVPIRFGEAVLGILTVHRMKGAGKNLPKGARTSLAHGVKNLVPFILKEENTGVQPFNLVNEFVRERIERAQERRDSLHFIVFLLKNDKNHEKKEDRAVFFDLAQKTHTLIKKAGDPDGILTKRVDLNKSLFVTDDMKDVEADEIIKKVRSEFGKILNRKKTGSRFTLSSLIMRYPQDTRDPHEILEWIYRGKVTEPIRKTGNAF